jgi:hypothetical protein
VPISELVFGTLAQNRSSLEPSLEFAAIARRALWIVHDTYKGPSATFVAGATFTVIGLLGSGMFIGR